ncbi:putative lateral flagellar export/assembly protein LafU [Citrobacter portucalensis]|uniref:putative lateral flagellar export/assembly protein LafU n=1 Tax=Citrobacter portucalensis TaxID=1639133 RepID=UPI003CEBA12B
MRSRNNKEQTTIIKRSASKGHDSFHGGAWKVAFADFTLAMMALFMVLWIMGSVNEEERQGIVSNLNGDNLFEGHSISPITRKEAGGKMGALTTSYALSNSKASDKGSVEPRKDATQQLNQSQSLEDVNTRSQREIEDLARIIMKITSAYDAQSNLKLEIVPQGLRILITDDQKREMFQRSSAILSPFFNRLLSEFAPALSTIDNKIIITGHTDATHFRDQELYNNWNLSGERAMQARKVLTRNGLDQNQILQVSGMADQMLLEPQNPLSSANRRIEIMVLTSSASESLYQFFGQHGEKVIKPLTDKLLKN